MMQSSEGTGFLTRFGALRRRMSYEKNCDNECLLSRSAGDPGRLWEGASIRSTTL